MPENQKRHLGELPPKYNFVLNPYPDKRLSRCPYCERKTGQRKLPLLIHIDPLNLIALNYTCRYCHQCDLLMAHKSEIEYLLYSMFSEYDPSAIGNDYLIIGTVEKKAWRAGLKQPKDIKDIFPHSSDFKTVYSDLRLTQAGWYQADEEPLEKETPHSREWVKAGSGSGIRNEK